MRFTPKTQQEIDQENLLAPGIYGFEIVSAEDATSRAGNEMIVLSLHVFTEEGRQVSLKDYLLESIAYKLHHAAEACGLADRYARGELDAVDFTGKTGNCKVVIQKDKTGQYADKNSIADYLPQSTGASYSPAPAPNARKPVHAGAGSSLDDEVPF